MLSACAALSGSSPEASKGEPKVAAPAEASSKAPSGEDAAASKEPVALSTARKQYEQGDFAGALKTLQRDRESWDVGGAKSVEGYKLMAFSQCVQRQRKACQQSFESALKIDPDFNLSAAEAGHPMWGPVYLQARKSADAAARKARNTKSH